MRRGLWWIKCFGAAVCVAVLVLGLVHPGCGGDDDKTGIWVRVTSPNIPIDKVVLLIFEQDGGQDGGDAQPIGEAEVTLRSAKTFDALSELPENQLWVLILAGKVHQDSTIRIQGTGFNDEREVASGEIEGLKFIRDKIYDADQVIELTHSGECTVDADNDGYYDANCGGDDCNDNDPEVHPDQTEVCDEMDNNCNASIDEGCGCAQGSDRECWPDWAEEPAGPPCLKGLQRCPNGTWGECEGLVLPSSESCLDGKDNDCDGFTDDRDTECGGCVVDTWETCYTGPEGTAGVGICQDGQWECVGGAWGPCENEVLPNGWDGTPGSQSEQGLCNDRDDDCDGVTDNVDEDDFPSCTKQCGVCAGSTQTCFQGLWVDCNDEEYLAHAEEQHCDEQDEPRCCRADIPDCYVLEENTELCDKLDNDCNCLPDDPPEGVCTCDTGDQMICPREDDPVTPEYEPDLGACVEGVYDCIGVDWVKDDVCVVPAGELCDNVDNDCDGTVDRNPQADAHCMENLQAYAELMGCFDGTCVWTCSRNAQNEQIAWDLNDDRNQPGGSDEGDGCEYICTLTVPSNEACDGLDNDCDSLTDGDDDVDIGVLCPARDSSSVTRCEAPRDCDYACVQPFDDCNGDLDDAIPLPGQPEYGGDGCEINLTNNRNHCGACNNACDDQEHCVAGGCSCGGDGPDCTWPDICCGSTCYNSQADENHCGDCNTQCDTNEQCTGGSCLCGGSGSDCAGSQTNFCCDTECVDLNTDERYCGNCGIQCDTNEQCSNGDCLCGGSGPDCSGSQTNFCCDTECVNLNTDEFYCGDCNTQCDTNEQCASGDCSCGGVGPDCTGDPNNFCCGTQCVNLRNDESNCGSCGNTCTNAHGSTSCTSLVCVPNCNAGWADCDGDPDDGCEEEIWETADCGTACGNRFDCNTRVDNATGINCSSGYCDYGSCNSSYANCDGDRTNGCETYLWQASSCGTACGNRVDCNDRILNASGVVCSNGSCDFGSCNSDYGNCNGDRTDGCEEDIWQPTSCGTSCGNRVDCTALVQHATGVTCSSGSYDYGSCQAGWADCDGNRANGCEEDIWETADCGTNCGNRVDCTGQVQHATGVTCNNGSCDFSGCDSGWGNCDGNRTNGCETDVWQTDACGTNCGNRVDCNVQVDNASGIYCNSGFCDYVTCDSGYGNCDGIDANGCETDFSQTATCGTTCGNVTNCTSDVQNATGITCSSNACDFSSCDDGWGNCEGDATNGCEENIWQTDSCGTTCGNVTDCTSDVQNATGAYCNSGDCDYGSCDAGWGNCDNDPSDGCEEDIWQTTSCGTCGNLADCTADVLHATPITCTSGSCGYGACDFNWLNCDVDPTNGCEADRTADTTCGMTCALVDCTVRDYDKICVIKAGIWRCGCNSDDDCGGFETICNTGLNFCQ